MSSVRFESEGLLAGREDISVVQHVEVQKLGT